MTIGDFLVILVCLPVIGGITIAGLHFMAKAARGDYD